MVCLAVVVAELWMMWVKLEAVVNIGGVPPPPYLGWKSNGMLGLRAITGCKIF